MNRKQRRAAGKNQAIPAQRPTGGPTGGSAGGGPALEREQLRLAVTHHQAGRRNEAEALYRDILRANPRNATALNHLGLIQRDRGNLDEAARLIREAVAADPRDADAHNNLGTLYKTLRDLPQAEACFRRALKLNPRSVEANVNLGAILQDQDRQEEAIAAYHAALKLRPNHAEALNNIGVGLRSLLRFEEAKEHFFRALRINPTYAPAYNNLGVVYRRQRRYDAALAAYRMAMAIDPALINAQYNYGTCSLQTGRLDLGWPLYEHGFALNRRRPRRRLASPPRWKGEDLAGKRLLVWREQGIGDELMFSTCLPDLIPRAGKVIVECDARLVPLFARSLPEAEVRPADSLATTIPDADAHVPMGGLPEYLRPTLDSFPDQPGYLRADPNRIAYWKQRVDALGGGLAGGLKIGICWRSGMLSRVRSYSYMNLDMLKPFLSVPGAVFVNLQYDDCAEEIAEAEQRHGFRLHRMDGLDLKDDLDGAAALIANLDLVISAPTSVGEMAGALGIPVWRFSQNTDWSLLGGLQRPWFPSMRVFVRDPNEAWTDVVDHMTDNLRSVVADPAPLRRERARACTLQAALPETAPATDTPPELGYDEKKNPRFQQQPDDSATPSGEPLAEAAALLGENRFLEALNRYQAILKNDPVNIAALFGAGNVAKELGEFDGAITLYQTVLQLDPGSIEAANNLGSVLRQLGRYDEAVEVFREAIGRKQDEPRLWLNLGATLAQRRGPDDNANARLFYEEALRLDPKQAEPHANLALLLRSMGELDQSFVHFRKALELKPDDNRLRFNHALTELAFGRLETGWRDYEVRHAPGMQKAIDYRHGLPRWQGEDLSGKSILISGEQGLGDQIVFAACLPDVIDRAARVVVDVEPRLVPLFRRSFPKADIRPYVMTQENGRCVFTYDWLKPKPDIASPIGSLPRFLRARIEDFPEPDKGRQSYLQADAARVAIWREKLAALGPEPKIGICWRSGLQTPDRKRFYTDLAAWGPILTLPGLRFVNLQYDDCAEELAAAAKAFGVTIQNFADIDQRNDLDETAALISALDMVVSAPTAVQAMAGALGVPTLLLGSSWLTFSSGRFPFQPSVTLVRGTPEAPMLDHAAAIVKERF
ncbi:tetratricopeptide repeat protein [Oceanibaculum nanhaiense]|uniref:tetratricopeptide repeat protein n=1 Tax=Oceanibaculum nanhaiense TaxID=1909734 RepID=UPI00396E2488